jgi:hypothetical protein
MQPISVDVKTYYPAALLSELTTSGDDFPVRVYSAIACLRSNVITVPEIFQILYPLAANEIEESFADWYDENFDCAGLDPVCSAEHRVMAALGILDRLRIMHGEREGFSLGIIKLLATVRCDDESPLVIHVAWNGTVPPSELFVADAGHLLDLQTISEVRDYLFACMNESSGHVRLNDNRAHIHFNDNGDAAATRH